MMVTWLLTVAVLCGALFLFGWAAFNAPKSRPQEDTVLIHFSCDGCMASDWKEVERGHIIRKTTRSVYNGNADGRLEAYYVVSRADGSTFEAYAGYCHLGSPDMQRFTDNPEESLAGKMVYLT